MHVGVLITNGGPHPPEKWAVATAEQLFPISNDVAADKAIVAKQAQLAITQALLPHHQAQQSDEQAKLKANGDAHLGRPLDVDADADKAFADILIVVEKSPWAEKTKNPEWCVCVRELIATHFRTARQIERQWHCHRNVNETTKAFLAKVNGG